MIVELKEAITNELRHLGQSDSRILSLYILGSLVYGNFKDNSDVDVAILLHPDQKIDPTELLSIGNNLTIKIGRRVDLGIISSRNLIYSSEVLYKGELVYTDSEDEHNLLRANLLGIYLNFNEERKEVLDAYRT